MVAYKIGEAVCIRCGKKIEAGAKVTAVLSATSEWFCQECMLKENSLSHEVHAELGLAEKLTAEQMGERFWSRYPGFLRAQCHTVYESRTGCPTVMFMVDGKPTCASCLLTKHPEAYRDLLARLEKRKEAAGAKS